jgi:hypothetical protein
MTGRNHDAVGFGMVSEFAGLFPGYSAMLPKDCQPFVKTLQGNGLTDCGSPSASGEDIPDFDIVEGS